MYLRIKPSFLAVLFLSVLQTACGGGSGSDATLALAFLANKNDPTVFELYVASRDGRRIEQRSGALDPANDVLDFTVAPTGEYIAYRTGTSGGRRLHVASVQSATTVEVPGLSGAIPLVSDYAWSPDGRYVAFRAQDDVNSGINLYVYDLTEHSTQRLNAIDPMRVTFTSVLAFQWAPMGLSLAYTADEDSEGVVELYALAPDGGDKRKLSAALNTNQDVSAFAWAPDGTAVAYRAGSSAHSDLFAAAANGSANWLLSAGVTNPGVDADTFSWAPDTQAVAYTVLDTMRSTSLLYVVAANGGGNTLISTNVPDSGQTIWFKWSPDAAKLMFAADPENDGSQALFTANASGGGLVELTNGGNLSVGSALTRWSPDGTRIALPVDLNTPGTFDLFVATTDGSSMANLTDLEPVNGALIDVRWSPDATQLVYRTLDLGTSQIATVATEADGANRTVLDTSATDATLLLAPQWLLDGDTLAFVSDTATPTLAQLYVSSPEGPPTAVSGEFQALLSAGNGVSQFSGL